MKTSKSFLLIFICSIFINCSDNDLEYDLPYFQFRNEDKPNLLNLPELDLKLIFVNQNNEELYFDVVKSESRRQLYASRGISFLGSSGYFYHDEQNIHLRSYSFDKDDFRNFLEINVKKFPVEFDTNVSPVILSEESFLATNIRYSGTFNNSGQSTFVKYKNLLTMNFNSKQYLKVIKIDLTQTDSNNRDWNLPTLNFFYFDINEGIIGFDDRDGNQWRLKS